MVNYFDVATPEEIKETFEEDLSPEQIAFERARFDRFPDSNYAKLYGLYLGRDEPEEAEKYLDLIEDPIYKQGVIDIAHDLEC